MALEFSQAVKRIPVYPVAGAYGLSDDTALMASNESPEPPLEAVVTAAARALLGTNRYPDPGYRVLRAALSDRYGVDSGRIAVGNGSCDILLAIGQALLEPGAEIVYAWPSFSVYSHLAAASGATAVTVALNDRHEHDLQAMLAAITVATRLVLVCNPNNPTSTALPFAQLEAFVAQVPSRICIVLDEAYIEYSTLDDPDATIDLLARFPNLVLLRTFSKIYGLCGLRVGYALCGSDEIVTATTQVRQPFSLNVAAQAAAVEALKHGDEITARVERAVAARLKITEDLSGIGIYPAASEANFVWFDLPSRYDDDPAASERHAVAYLADGGVQVRAGSALGRPGALRVSFGNDRHNERFLRLMGKLFA